MSLIAVAPGRITSYIPYVQDLGVIIIRRGDTMFLSLGSPEQLLRDERGVAWNFNAIFSRILIHMRRDENSPISTTFSTENNSLVRDTGRLILYQPNTNSEPLSAGTYKIDGEFYTAVGGHRYTMYEATVILQGDITKTPSTTENASNLLSPAIQYPVVQTHPLSMLGFGYAGDLTPPKVEITPRNGSNAVPTNSIISTVFSEEIRTLIGNLVTNTYMEDRAIAFQEAESGEAVPFNVAHSGLRYEIIPTVSLKPGTAYLITVKDLKDGNGNLLSVTQSVFTTEVAIDSSTFWTVDPANGAQDIGINRTITFASNAGVLFLGGAPISQSNISQIATISRKADDASVPYTFSITNNADGTTSIALRPSGTLSFNTTYELEIVNTQTAQGVENPRFVSEFITETGIAPSAPSSLVVTNVNQTAATLDWQPGEGAVSYIVEYSTSDVFATVLTVPSQQSNKIVPGLTESTQYYMRVNAVNSAGASGYSNVVTLTTQDATASNQPPVAGFTFQTSGLTASFSNASSDADNDTLTYLWRFGDGTTSTSLNPSHTYNAAGTYQVSLEVSDGQEVDTDVKSITVSEPVQTTPVGLRAFGASSIPSSESDITSQTSVGNNTPSTQTVTIGLNDGQNQVFAVHNDYIITSLSSFGFEAIGDFTEIAVGNYRVYHDFDKLPSDGASTLTYEVVTQTA